MRTVFHIFKSDISSIIRSIFVLIIVIALCVLPSLYAWINIYASWDPYGNTEELEIALASRDTGIKLQDGTYVNTADEVIADIRDDERIRYVPMDTADEAVEGVNSGRYHAAIVFEDGFTYDMHHFEEAIGDREEKITYYTNVKNNAVALKIIDNYAEEITGDINSKYLQEMLTKYFSDTGDVIDQVDTDEAVDTALAQLIGTRDAIHDFNTSISQIRSSGGDVTKSLKNAEKKLKKARKNGKSDAAAAKSEIEQAKAAISDVSKQFDSKTSKLESALSDLEKDPTLEKADRVLTILQDLRGMLPDKPQTTAGRVAADALDVMIKTAEHIKTLLQSDPQDPEILSDIETLKQLFEQDLKPSLELMLSDINKALERTEPLLKSADGVLDDINPVLDSAESTVSGLDTTLSALQGTLVPLEEKLNGIIEQVQDAEDADKEGVLTKLLGNDAQQYSAFFTDFTEVESEQYYKPVSFGAAMSPFYTIIALWVGGVMLVTLLQCTVNREKFPQITETQGFFGRFLLFFLIGQIQAAIVVAGNIFMLHCAPVHPWLMWLSAAFTSMVFVILIYALTLAFGDIGRAAVIVIMMVQIAGSSGSFPIEILPDIFDKIYRFFPFPYAINAMREAMFGLYDHYFLMYLAQLMAFFIGAVLIGVFVRRPFIGVKTFMSEKIKETEVM